MGTSKRTKIGIIVGMIMIVTVASLIGLPFSESDSSIQKITQDNIKRYEESEEKMLKFIHHEKEELSYKLGGKLP